MSELANYIYDRTIDYIELRGRDNEIRDMYERHMSSQGYNNPEMAELIDVITILVEDELDRCRDDREVEALIKSIVVSMTDNHVGRLVMADQAISDSVSDQMYTDLKTAAIRYEDVIARISGGRSGARRAPYAGGVRDTGPRRSVFDNVETRPLGGARRGVFGNLDQPREDRRQSNSVFSGIRSAAAPAPVAHAPGRAFDVQRRDVPPAPRSSLPSNGLGGVSSPARSFDRAPTAPTEPVARTPVVADGPDMSKERPYDDFWVDGERWQIAHKSKFTWSWTRAQQTRRMYDPDNEVCFLVKGKDGSVREEFLPMTDDLIESAHEIRQASRPYARSPATGVAESDSFFEGDDLDLPDLDKLYSKENVAAAIKYSFEQFKAANKRRREQTMTVGDPKEAVVMVAGEATKYDEHVVAADAMVTIMLPGDAPTKEALKSIDAVASDDGDLSTLRKRLKSLKGSMAENVLRTIDRHYTDEVNSALRDQFGHEGLSMDSFIEDFDDLLTCSRFAQLGAGYANQFLQRTRPIKATLAYVVDQEELEEIMDCYDILGIGEEDTDAYTRFRENVVVMFRQMSLVHVKMDSSELGLVTNQVRVPDRKNNPQMAGMLDSLYRTAREGVGAGRVYIVTADHMTYELVAISGARDIIGIKLVDL